ncbi:HAD-like protein [Eremomyces bilateralis CBS 781.70]|uniref:HAD-like protein n=1 Tax=Eremomyces bilateralis CBS 781.70 TaxID=1392243 RepID=A0A6G1FS60_9PEZI|nr:HAD-like protein [Eremomyces bilateralis CBS 781.70]KAF1808695.1 HAD-like protein [Eremomyces bilateralis CBS 781.70]
MDGTLCEPQNYMFGEMRNALGIEKPTDILDHIYSLPDEEQEIAMEKIRAIERQAMTLQKPQAGLIMLMAYIESKGIPKAICTRNFDGPVNHLLGRYLTEHHFHPIVTREFRPAKPDPAGILHIASEWGLDGAASVIMVGDSLDDMTAGYRAGAATVLLMNETNQVLADHEHTDLTIRRLDELIDILDNGFQGRLDS